MLSVLLLLSCAHETQSETTRAQIFTRASLDIRGRRPSLEELDRVIESDDHLEQELESLLNSSNFGWQYAQTMSGFWKTQVIELDHRDHQYSMTNYLELITAMGQEPLYFLAEIVDNDLPYSQFVTAPWTVNNEILAEWSPVDYPENEAGWKRVFYTDGRPSAGILTSNGLWWRYNSTQNNAHRGRANILSKNLLCNDFLERSVEIDRDLNLLDETAIHDALNHAPSCYTCHSSLDQLASNFWGFYRHFRFNPEEQFSYHFERERDWSTFTGVQPGYFGTPTQSLAELGQQIAADPQYYSCLVERTMEQLYHRPLALSDIETKQEHLRVFEENSFTIKPLVLEIISDPIYQNISPQTQKQISIHRYASQLQELSGYRFSTAELDVLDADHYGLRSMAGGVGADHNHQQFLSTSPTFILVIERLAQAGADQLIQDPAQASRRLGISLNSEISDSQIKQLFRNILSRYPAPEEQEQITQLWFDIFTLESSRPSAWKGVLLYLFRHPDFLRY